MKGGWDSEKRATTAHTQVHGSKRGNGSSKDTGFLESRGGNGNQKGSNL